MTMANDLPPPPDLAAQLDGLAQRMVWSALVATLLRNSAAHIRAQAARIAELERALEMVRCAALEEAIMVIDKWPIGDHYPRTILDRDVAIIAALRALQAKRGEDETR